MFVPFGVSSWFQLDADRNGYTEQVDRRFWRTAPSWWRTGL